MNAEDRAAKIAKVEACVAGLLDALEIPLDFHTSQTPRRVAKMYVDELLVNHPREGAPGQKPWDRNLVDLHRSMTSFPSCGDGHPITVTVPFHSLCAHHMLPFYGTARITYIPNMYMIGLSKIPRVVEHFSKRLQVQEQLTQDIADYLGNVLKPYYIKVELLDVVHLCVTMRGVKSIATTDTVVELGDPN